MFRRAGLTLGVVAALAAHVLACASAGNPALSSDHGLPDVGYLRLRVERLYTAEQAGDWQTWYSMAGPDLKTEQGAKEFWDQAGKRRAFTIISWRVHSVRALEQEEVSDGADAAAAVAMDVRVEEPGGTVRKEDGQTDYWVHIKGEWYWTWRGWPDD